MLVVENIAPCFTLHFKCYYSVEKFLIVVYIGNIVR